jgi:hypothetical protein
MREPDITIRGTRHKTAHEAIQYLSVSGDDFAILLGEMILTVKRAEVERLQAGGFPFAYLFDRDGQIMTVPVGHD